MEINIQSLKQKLLEENSANWSIQKKISITILLSLYMNLLKHNWQLSSTRNCSLLQTDIGINSDTLTMFQVVLMYFFSYPQLLQHIHFDLKTQSTA